MSIIYPKAISSLLLVSYNIGWTTISNTIHSLGNI